MTWKPGLTDVFVLLQYTEHGEPDDVVGVYTSRAAAERKARRLLLTNYDVNKVAMEF